MKALSRYLAVFSWNVFENSGVTLICRHAIKLKIRPSKRDASLRMLAMMTILFPQHKRMRSEWTEFDLLMSSFSKSSVFRCPHENTKMPFSKVSTLESIFKSFRFRWPFYMLDTCGREAKTERNLHFQMKMNTCENHSLLELHCPDPPSCFLGIQERGFWCNMSPISWHPIIIDGFGLTLTTRHRTNAHGVTNRYKDEHDITMLDFENITLNIKTQRWARHCNVGLDLAKFNDTFYLI